MDMAGRLGGEEFALLLPDADTEGAAATAERLRGALDAGPIARADGRDLSVTASFGVAHYFAGQSGDELLRIADDALYRAKEEGKNRVSPASTAA